MKTKDHNPEWDFYLTEVDGKPASITVDLGLKSVAPVSNFENLFWLSVKMNQPTENGLSSNEESKILWEIEDAIVPTMHSKHEVIYAGRLTSDGHRDYFFYFGDDILLDKTVSSEMVSFPKYDYDYGVKANDNWTSYHDLLYPTSEDFQMMSNRRVLEVLEEKGDKLNVPREVNHWIYFKNEEDKVAFERVVTEQNFTTIDSGFDPEFGEYAYKLVISKAEPVDLGEINSYSSELMMLAEQFNGDYDGWECPMILNDDNAEDN